MSSATIRDGPLHAEPHPRSSKIREMVAFPVIVSVITILVAIVFSEVQSRIGWVPLAAAVVCFLLIYAVTLIVVGIQYRPVYVGLIEQLRDAVIGIVDPNRLGIIDNAGLAIFENATRYREIWLVTADLVEDVPSAPFFDAVHLNLRHGTNYIYFCPRSARTEGRVASIRQAHGTVKGKLRFVSLPDDFFFLTPRLDFCIFDPFNIDGERCGFMGLPINTAKHVHGRMDPELIDSLVGKLEAYKTQEEEP